MKWKFLWRLLRDAFNNFLNDRALRMAGALAYYSVFSMAPLVLIAIGVASQVFGQKAARGEILDQVGEVIGPSARQSLEDILNKTGGSPTNSVIAAVIGVAVLLFGASGVFAELQDGLNNIWKVKPKEGLGLWTLVKDRLLSVTVVLGTGFLLLVSLLLSAVLAAVAGWLERKLPGLSWIWHALNSLLSFAVVALLFAMIFKILPDAKIDWRDVWIGAVVTAVLFTVGKAVIGAYLGHSGVADTYGAAGSVVILLTWVYYSAVILLFGAEFTHVYALQTRWYVPPTENAVSTAKPGDKKAATAIGGG